MRARHWVSWIPTQTTAVLELSRQRATPHNRQRKSTSGLTVVRWVSHSLCELVTSKRSWIKQHWLYPFWQIWLHAILSNCMKKLPVPPFSWIGQWRMRFVLRMFFNEMAFDINATVAQVKVFLLVFFYNFSILYSLVMQSGHVAMLLTI